MTENVIFGRCAVGGPSFTSWRRQRIPRTTVPQRERRSSPPQSFRPARLNADRRRLAVTGHFGRTDHNTPHQDLDIGPVRARRQAGVEECEGLDSAENLIAHS